MYSCLVASFGSVGSHSFTAASWSTRLTGISSLIWASSPATDCAKSPELLEPISKRQLRRSNFVRFDGVGPKESTQNTQSRRSTQVALLMLGMPTCQAVELCSPSLQQQRQWLHPSRAPGGTAHPWSSSQLSSLELARCEA